MPTSIRMLILVAVYVQSSEPGAALQQTCDTFAIAPGAFVALTYFKVQPASVMLMALVFGLIVYR